MICLTLYDPEERIRSVLTGQIKFSTNCICMVIARWKLDPFVWFWKKVLSQRIKFSLQFKRYYKQQSMKKLSQTKGISI